MFTEQPVVARQHAGRLPKAVSAADLSFTVYILQVTKLELREVWEVD